MHRDAFHCFSPNRTFSFFFFFTSSSQTSSANSVLRAGSIHLLFSLSLFLLFSLCLPSHSLTLTLPKASNVLATAAAHSLTCSPWLRISQFIFLCPSVESFQPELSGFESGPYRLMIHSLTRLSYYFIALFWGTCSYFVFIRC